jgi:hypothetical protein
VAGSRVGASNEPVRRPSRAVGVAETAGPVLDTRFIEQESAGMQHAPDAGAPQSSSGTPLASLSGTAWLVPWSSCSVWPVAAARDSCDACDSEAHVRATSAPLTCSISIEQKSTAARGRIRSNVPACRGSYNGTLRRRRTRRTLRRQGNRGVRGMSSRRMARSSVCSSEHCGGADCTKRAAIAAS